MGKDSIVPPTDFTHDSNYIVQIWQEKPFASWLPSPTRARGFGMPFKSQCGVTLGVCWNIFLESSLQRSYHSSALTEWILQGPYEEDDDVPIRKKAERLIVTLYIFLQLQRRSCSMSYVAPFPPWEMRFPPGCIKSRRITEQTFRKSDCQLILLHIARASLWRAVCAAKNTQNFQRQSAVYTSIEEKDGFVQVMSHETQSFVLFWYFSQLLASVCILPRPSECISHLQAGCCPGTFMLLEFVDFWCMWTDFSKSTLWGIHTCSTTANGFFTAIHWNVGSTNVRLSEALLAVAIHGNKSCTACGFSFFEANRITLRGNVATARLRS